MAAERLDAVLGALADPASRRAVEVLGAGPKRAGELADILDLTAPAMSRKLKTLKQAGLVEEAHPEFDARVRIYALKAGARRDRPGRRARHPAVGRPCYSARRVVVIRPDALSHWAGVIS